MCLFPTTEQKVLDIINQLAEDKAIRYDDVSVKLVELCGMMLLTNTIPLLPKNFQVL